jgi:hypothetical protein
MVKIKINARLKWISLIKSFMAVGSRPLSFVEGLGTRLEKEKNLTQ